MIFGIRQVTTDVVRRVPLMTTSLISDDYATSINIGVNSRRKLVAAAICLSAYSDYENATVHRLLLVLIR